MVAVAFFPAQAARQSAKIPGFLGEFQTQLPVNFEDDQVLSGTELETFSEFFWNHISKLQVQTKGWNEHRPAGAIVSGVIDVLCVQRRKNASPDVRRVVSFEDVLTRVT
jgi:hypothetical protein